MTGTSGPDPAGALDGPRVFISYAHEDDGGIHAERVRSLWLLLRANGIDARLDRPAAEEPQDWATWMQREVESADFVVVIASAAYKRRAEGTESPHVGEGVAWEARLLRDTVYRDPTGWHKRIIRVVLPGTTRDDLPSFLGGHAVTHYTIDPLSPVTAESLVRYLTGQPYETTPPVALRPTLLSRDGTPSTAASEPHLHRLHSHTIHSRPAADICLAQLLRLQYPWGEWSDRRTELESLIAERLPGRGTAIPKPNVARTLFALEALEFFEGPRVNAARAQAISWMKSNLAGGWFWEWREGQTSHSETRIPEIIRRADVRHTAQVLTAFSRWQTNRDPLASMVRSISASILSDSGFWPDNPHGSVPRLLASVYAVEALQSVASGVFRLPLSDIVDRREENEARRTLRQGIGALLDDCERGEGLMGSVTSSPNSYLTGLALFRLGYLAGRHSDLDELINLMIDGLLRSVEDNGWNDSSVPLSVRSTTRLRTTLRCASGLARANSSGAEVPPPLLEHAVQLAENIIVSEPPELLDSPDYACGLITIFLTREPSILEDVLETVEENGVDERSERISLWRTEYELLIEHLNSLAEIGVSGYTEVARDYQERLRNLS